MGFGVHQVPGPPRKGPTMDRGEIKSARKDTALCECGSEGLWTVWDFTTDGWWGGSGARDTACVG
jgi:hypothetical protein